MAPDRTTHCSASTVSASRTQCRAAQESAHRRKRLRLAENGASAYGMPASGHHLFDESALIPTSVPEESTDASHVDSNSSSDLSESSEEPSSEDSSDEHSDDSCSNVEDETADGNGVVNLRANRGSKPKMKLSRKERGPDLRSFLRDFLPQLRAANDELEAQRDEGTLENQKIEYIEGNDSDDGEDGQYIEMDLGLGVLEEKDTNAGDDSDSSSDGDSTGKKDVMGKLMGRNKSQGDVGIEEVRNADHT